MKGIAVPQAIGELGESTIDRLVGVATPIERTSPFISVHLRSSPFPSERVSTQLTPA